MYFVFHVGKFFNSKMRRGVAGRKKLFEELILKSSKLDKSKPLLWFHSSSLGEFEQAKPIIESFKELRTFNILVTFFSPSGYENAKKYPFADVISYIPFDFYYDARKFVEICNPTAAIVMRYDLWPNHIHFLHEKHIPVFLVDATLRENSSRNKIFIKSFHRQLFSQLSGILTVSDSDLRNFSRFFQDESKLRVVGDTRFDRVEQKSNAAKERNLIRQNLFNGKQVIVAGSTWEEDENVLIPVIKKLHKYHPSSLFIIVPHEPAEQHIDNIEQEFGPEIPTIRFSFLNDYKDQPVIIVDSIGILLTLYYYASIAFIGGSFKSSIHNVLEAAVYGIPVVYGPKIQTSQEAQELVKIGGGLLVKNKNELYRTFRSLLQNDKDRLRRGEIAKQYIRKNLGATRKILDYIMPFLRNR